MAMLDDYVRRKRTQMIGAVGYHIVML